MAKNNSIRIEKINENSPHLETVISLGDSNSKTLGFLPQVVFQEKAKRELIFVALSEENTCVGYVLFTLPRQEIKIVHLCIDNSYRGQGIAKKLVDHLSKTYQEREGIGLTCRQDFQEATKLWEKLGFIPKNSKPAKTKGKILVKWWLDHGHKLNLFSQQALESKLSVVIDLNIFLALYNENNSNNTEAKSLIGDWIQDDLELCITEDIYSWIQNNSNLNQDKIKVFANDFTCLNCGYKKFNLIRDNLSKFVKKNRLVIEESELRYLARAIGSNIYIFITQNEALLSKSNQFFEQFKVSILSPNQLLSQIDELSQKPNYCPSRLSGTYLEEVTIKKGQENELSKYFLNKEKSENLAEFKQKLYYYLSQPNNSCLLIKDDKQPLVLIVYGRYKNHELEILMFRVGNHELSYTLADHLLFKARFNSAKEGRQFTKISDNYLEDIVIQVIQDQNVFYTINNNYVATNLGFVKKLPEVSNYLTNLVNNSEPEYTFLTSIANSIKTEIPQIQYLVNIERRFFPLKIKEAEIPTFIIPIKPEFAKDLFAENLAEELLPLADFRTSIDLAFNQEAVYYKSITNKDTLKPPARILWYISNGNFRDVSCISASAYIDEVIIGKYEELYQRFQKFGVYKLNDLTKIATDKKGNIKDIMAIKFSDIEIFKQPINLTKIKEILNKKVTFQGLIKITQKEFIMLYNLGMKYVENN